MKRPEPPMRLARWVKRRLRGAPHAGARPRLEGLEPVSRWFGFDRGRPIDRFYIERFLAGHRDDVRGRVLEIAEPTYTQWFGSAVTRSDVLHAAPGNPQATLVGDLVSGDGIPEAAFDCVILTQTLSVIYEAARAVEGVHHCLRPGGVLLVSVPGISQISRADREDWGEYWRFTRDSVRTMLADARTGSRSRRTATSTSPRRSSTGSRPRT